MGKHLLKETTSNKRLIIYSAGHFLIDFACAVMILGTVVRHTNDLDTLLCVLLYNFCAFALQAPIGRLADSYNRNNLVALYGSLLVFISTMVVKFVSILGMTRQGWMIISIILGLGNAMFHVGGGIDTLNDSKEKAYRLGIFVSPGAFGIYLGTLLTSFNIPYSEINKGDIIKDILYDLSYATDKVHSFGFIEILLIILGIFLFRIKYTKGKKISNNSDLSLNIDSKGRIALMCCFIVVILRSYIGFIVEFPWKNGYIPVLLCTLAVIFGKVAGGFLGDKIGMQDAAILSLGLSSILFVFSQQIMIAGIMALFLFNMSMPITLWISAKVLSGAKGFSFGLLTFALFIGFIPVFLDYKPLVISGIGYDILTLFSTILLAIGTTGINKGGKRLAKYG